MKMHKPKNNTGIRRIINACRYSYQGLIATFRSEAAFRQECYVGLIALPSSFLIASNIIEWILLVITFLLVMLVEIINSALEAAIDRFGQERHELSGKAKDAGSAAVSLAIIMCLITWGSIILF